MYVLGILQFRPSHSYFDKQDKRKGEKGKADSDDEEDAPDQVIIILIWAVDAFKDVALGSGYECL